jgi:hypothetical protein
MKTRKLAEAIALFLALTNCRNDIQMVGESRSVFLFWVPLPCKACLLARIGIVRPKTLPKLIMVGKSGRIPGDNGLK